MRLRVFGAARYVNPTKQKQQTHVKNTKSSNRAAAKRWHRKGLVLKNTAAWRVMEQKTQRQRGLFHRHTLCNGVVECQAALVEQPHRLVVCGGA